MAEIASLFNSLKAVVSRGFNSLDTVLRQALNRFGASEKDLLDIEDSLDAAKVEIFGAADEARKSIEQFIADEGGDPPVDPPPPPPPPAAIPIPLPVTLDPPLEFPTIPQIPNPLPVKLEDLVVSIPGFQLPLPVSVNLENLPQRLDVNIPERPWEQPLASALNSLLDTLKCLNSQSDVEGSKMGPINITFNIGSGAHPCHPPRPKAVSGKIYFRNLPGPNSKSILIGEDMLSLPDDAPGVTGLVIYRDSIGNPTAVDGPPSWSATPDGALTITPSEDGMSATIVPVGPLAKGQIRVAADPLVGEGVEELLVLEDFEVVAGKAVSGTINFTPIPVA